MILALVITLGLSLGKIKVKGVSLGLAWILFIGLIFGHFSLNLDEHLLHFLKEFGLILFVYSIGLEVGPGFFSSFRGGGKSLNILSIVVVALSIVTTLVVYSFSGTSATTLVGILSGAVTNTPGLGAAQQAFSDLRHIDAPSIATGYAICLMAVLGPSIRNVILSLAVVSTPSMARMVRSAALSAREQTYVEAMTCLGATPSHILWRHIMPNTLSPVIVQMTFVFASAIITEAALSFLGAGVPVPEPSWGSILSQGRTYIYTAWWLILYPGLFTAVSVMGFNLFGDGVRDLLDPLSH